MKTSKSLVLFVLVTLSFLVVFSIVPEVQASEPTTYALNFDGSSYIKFPYKASYATTTFSASLWVKPTGAHTNIYTLIELSDGSGAGMNVWDFEIAGAGQNKVLVLETDSGTMVVNSTYTMLDDVWQFIAVTYDEATSNGTIYVDGVRKASEINALDPTSLPITSSDHIYIGAEYDEMMGAPQLFYYGLVDEVQLYNRVLTASEITANYNSGSGLYQPTNTTGLVLWSKFDEGTGTTTKDRTSNANTGTFYGGGVTWATGIIPDWYAVDSLYIQTNFRGTLSNPVLTQDKLTLSVSGSTGQTSITKVYCASLGEPKFVSGASSYSYNSATQQLTLNVIHSSSASIVVSWQTGDSGEYSVRITVSTDYLPTPGASIIINGENKTTDLFGSTTWTLSYGDYVIWAYCQGKNQSQAVSINQDRTIGFNFITTPDLPSPPNFTPLLIIAAVFVIGFILLSARRRK